MITIVDYRPEHRPYFEKFNRAWIEQFFVMEPLDIAVLQNPEEYILKNGGAILMALYNGDSKELGAETVILYSNTLQAAAIRLYEKLGFEHLPVENNVYKRANVKMKIDFNKFLGDIGDKSTVKLNHIET
jgi:hypothetical protein